MLQDSEIEQFGFYKGGNWEPYAKFKEKSPQENVRFSLVCFRLERIGLGSTLV